MSEKKEYHKKYYKEVTKVRKPYVITQKVPIQEWAKPDKDGQLLDTERYIFYINKIWSKHTLKYLIINHWGAYNIYDKNKILIRLKRENIISYIDKYEEYVTINPQNTQ
tara:strand:+ start:4142 stop:4468 length:327 start_codon:yes stop_codon:yes gene_type:complete